jgi:hypothetical protein
LVEISEPDGLGGYVSKRVTGAQLGDTNIYNTDGTLTGNRTIDLDGNLLKFENGQFEVDGSTGINIVPDGIVPAWLTIESTDTKRPLLVNSTSSADTALFQANTGYAVVATGNGASAIYGTNSASGYGVWGDSANSNAVYGTSSGATGVWGNGGVVAETYNIGSSRNASAVLQANSTTQGALLPRMTTTERNAIGSPATGLEIYNTTTNRKEVYNGTFWQGISMRFLQVFFSQWNPTDAQTVAFGAVPLTPQLASLSPAPLEIVMRGNGVIRGCDFTTFAAGVAGTNESWSLYVRHQGTDYLIQTVASNTNVRTFTNTSLNIPYVAGDIVRMVFVNPTWATNPTQVAGGGFLTIQ